MTRFGLTASVLTASVLLWSSSVSASTITINGGESPTFPPTFQTLALGGSPLNLPFTACCGVGGSFLVSGKAIGTPAPAPGSFLTNTIDFTTGPGTLILWFTEAGLTSSTGTANFTSSLTSDLLKGAIKSVTLSTFISLTDGVSPPNGTLLDTATFNNIGTQTSTTSLVTGRGPYSLQEVYTIVATGSGSAKLTIDLSTPEPATLALVGTALLGIGLFRRRRSTGY